MTDGINFPSELYINIQEIDYGGLRVDIYRKLEIEQEFVVHMMREGTIFIDGSLRRAGKITEGKDRLDFLIDELRDRSYGRNFLPR